MASTDLETFTWFSGFPVEVQKLVWEEAAADPPVLDIQRFTAEITVSQHDTNPGGVPLPLLCFTPHSDFINLTIGHRGLMGACRESRKAAQRLFDCLLPIRYLTMDTNENLLVRQAIVPFNPSGYFCISGLGRATHDARWFKRGARGSKLPMSFSLCDIKGLGDTTFPIKNLMISLDKPTVYPMSNYVCRGGDNILEVIASQLPNLETASILSEAMLDRRHHIDRLDFDRMHQRVAVVPKHERGYDEKAVSWESLWRKFQRQHVRFYVVMRNKLEAMERDQPQDSKGPGSVDGAAFAAEKRELGLTLAAIAD